MNEQEKTLCKDFKFYDNQCGSMWNWRQYKKETFSTYKVDNFEQLVIKNIDAAIKLTGFGNMYANSDDLD